MRHLSLEAIRAIEIAARRERAVSLLHPKRVGHA